MSIHTEEIREVRGGFSKELEASALPMILDNLQISQYQFPVKSTIRELVSNAVDAIRERDTAKLIITGKANEDDYYIRRDDALFVDSNFDPNYYSLQWLSDSPDVTIVYQEGGALGKDSIRIVDNGVGIGGSRLPGYFRLGYSSKRNSIKQLGKFGIGAKAGLSTGISFYTVINRYNGMEFRFNIYSQSIESIVPSFNTETNQPNPTYDIVSKDHKITVHYIPTNEKNGVEVILESKKHRKQEFIEAVQSQLLYFKNVKMVVRNENGFSTDVKIQPHILYEDDYLVLSDNDQYSKPHMVINGVNYGYVNFQELELEEKLGNIGIKVLAEEVSINPSRESLVWNEQTRQAVLDRFKKAADVATKLIQDSLKVDDFLKWLQTYLFARSRYTGGKDVISRLANLVDINGLSPAFIKDPDLRITSIYSLFPGINFQSITSDFKTKGGITERKLHRSDVTDLRGINPSKPIYITNSSANTETLEYLADKHTEGFYLVQYLAEYKFEYDELLKTDEFNKTKYDDINKVLKDRRRRVIGFIEKSSVSIQLDSVSVPVGFEFDKNRGLQVAQTEEQKALTPEQLRKLDERVVFYVPRGQNSQPRGNQAQPTTLYDWQKVQPKLKEVQALDGKEVYYTTQDGTDLLYFAAAISRPGDNLYTSLYTFHSYNNKPADRLEDLSITSNQNYNHQYINHWGPKARAILMKVAKDEVKNYSMYRPIKDFFVRVENGVLSASDLVTKWYTAKLIQDSLDQAVFLNHYSLFDPVMHAKYHQLEDYVNEWYRDIKPLIGKGYVGFSQKDYDEFVVLAERKTHYQIYKRHNPQHDEQAKQLSIGLFGYEYKDAVGVDLFYYDTLSEVLDYARPLSPMFNQIGLLTGQSSDPISPETEAAIHSYLSLRSLK